MNYFRNIPTYLIGSYQLVELGIAVTNTGEDAFGAYVQVPIPEDVTFSNVKMLTNPPILCLLPNENTLVCEIGNPLRANTTVSSSNTLQTKGYQSKPNMRTMRSMQTPSRTFKRPKHKDTNAVNFHNKNIKICLLL